MVPSNTVSILAADKTSTWSVPILWTPNIELSGKMILTLVNRLNKIASEKLMNNYRKFYREFSKTGIK